jgi:hypothetical protein
VTEELNQRFRLTEKRAVESFDGRTEVLDADNESRASIQMAAD